MLCFKNMSSPQFNQHVAVVVRKGTATKNKYANWFKIYTKITLR
jgi:hypothetical protein